MTVHLRSEDLPFPQRTHPCRVEEMRIGAALSTDPDPAKAASAALEEARFRLGGAEVSLAVVVASRHHAPSAEVATEAVRVGTGPERVIGCVAETVVGGDREVEGGPAVAVWLASLPEPVETFHMEFVRTSQGGVFGGVSLRGGRAPTCSSATPSRSPPTCCSGM
jgi:small ligand-binding sensory domain FIST